MYILNTPTFTNIMEQIVVKQIIQIIFLEN